MVVHPKRPSWPGALGIAMIVVNSVLALAALAAVAAPAISMIVMANLPPVPTAGGGPNPVEAQQQMMGAWGPALMAVSGTELLVNIYGVYAGVRLLQRRAGAPAHASRWAVSKIVIALVRSSVVGVSQFYNMDAMMGAAAASNAGAAGPPPAFMSAMTGVVMAVTAVAMLLQLLFVWALPVLWLFFWSKPATRAHAATWT